MHKVMQQVLIMPHTRLLAACKAQKATVQALHAWLRCQDDVLAAGSRYCLLCAWSAETLPHSLMYVRVCVCVGVLGYCQLSMLA